MLDYHSFGAQPLLPTYIGQSIPSPPRPGTTTDTGAQQQTTQSQQEPSSSPPKSPRPKWLIPAVIGIVVIIVVAAMAVLLLQDDNGNEDNNGSHSGPDVTLQLSSSKSTYNVGEEVVLDYYIKNNEPTNLSLEEYYIDIVLITGPNQEFQLYELTETLFPGEKVNGSLNVDRDFDPGEHVFELSLYEILGENYYLVLQTKRVVITVE